MKYHEKSELDMILMTHEIILNMMCFARGRGTNKIQSYELEINTYTMLKNLRQVKKIIDCYQKGYLNENEALTQVMLVTNSIKWVDEKR